MKVKLFIAKCRKCRKVQQVLIHGNETPISKCINCKGKDFKLIKKLDGFKHKEGT
jgi:predicted nucleic acid-binding Zn ribbon protein